METGFTPKLALIDLKIPNWKWIEHEPLKNNIPYSVPFGKHLGQISSPGDFKHPETTCDGLIQLSFSQKWANWINSNDSIFSTEHIPIEIKCSACKFHHNFTTGWTEAVLEWMRIAHLVALAKLINFNEQAYRKMEVWNLTTLFRYHPPVPAKLRDCILEDTVIFLEKYNIAIMQFKEITTEGLQNLVINANFLMDNIEKRFQDGIKRAAQLACSASEPYHFDTRRNK